MSYRRSRWNAEKKRHYWTHPPGGVARLYAPGGIRRGRVLLCEGEWDALMAWQRGYNAVGTTGGAGTVPAAELLEPLRDRDVFVAFDCDDAGRQSAEQWAKRLAGIGCTVHVVDLDLPEKGDVSDWFAKYERGAGELRELMDSTPQWSGEPDDVPDEARSIQPVDWDDFWGTEPQPIRFLVEPLIAAGGIGGYLASAALDPVPSSGEAA